MQKTGGKSQVTENDHLDSPGTWLKEERGRGERRERREAGSKRALA